MSSTNEPLDYDEVQKTQEPQPPPLYKDPIFWFLSFSTAATAMSLIGYIMSRSREAKENTEKKKKEGEK